MRVHTQLISLLTAGLMIVGCSGESGGGTEPSAASVTGTWGHTDPNLPQLGLVVKLNLVEGRDGSISGSGNVLINAPGNITVQGLHNHPNISLILSGSYCAGSFTGRFTDNNTIAGTTLTTKGDCLAGPWTLKRQ